MSVAIKRAHFESNEKYLILAKQYRLNWLKKNVSHSEQALFKYMSAAIKAASSESVKKYLISAK